MEQIGSLTTINRVLLKDFYNYGKQEIAIVFSSIVRDYPDLDAKTKQLIQELMQEAKHICNVKANAQIERTIGE